MTAVYNEIAPHAADWLRNLVAAGLVAPGTVDDRSVRDLAPDDVRDLTQFHAFAGIGGWSYALRLAGWPDDVPVWTGSCPCQPFSAAGRKKGFDDDRHLWPAWFELIAQCRPPVVFGEQVASPDGLKWLDAVQADLEDAGYAVGAADLPAACAGAPHKRQRLYFVAVADGQRLEGLRLQLRQRRSRENLLEAAGCSEARELADSADGGRSSVGRESRGEGAAGRRGAEPSRAGEFCELGDASSERSQIRPRSEDRPRTIRYEGTTASAPSTSHELGDASIARSRGDDRAVPRVQEEGPEERFGARRIADELVPAGTTSGFWADAEWWLCRDGKGRAAQPGSFPLAAGVPGRVGLLRGYGNAIVPQVAATFIRAVIGG